MLKKNIIINGIIFNEHTTISKYHNTIVLNDRFRKLYLYTIYRKIKPAYNKPCDRIYYYE